MAAKKKKPAPKVAKPTRKPTKKASKKAPARTLKPAVKAKAPVKKKKASRRAPPMHAKVNHPELDERDGEHDEAFEIFKSFDRDGSGSIDKAELARLLEALGQSLDEEELAVALHTIDSNTSGRVSWEEFKAWWSAL